MPRLGGVAPVPGPGEIFEYKCDAQQSAIQFAHRSCDLAGCGEFCIPLYSLVPSLKLIGSVRLERDDARAKASIVASLKGDC